MASFRAFLQKILSFASDDVKILLSEPGMLLFQKAFTHASIQQRDNYEVLEILGDKLVAATFVRYLYDRYPYISSSGIYTLLVTRYLDNAHFAKITTDLGFDQFIRINVKLTQKIKADVFEAFLGALSLAGDLIAPGYGFILVDQFTKPLFDRMDIVIESGKTEQLKAYTSRLNEYYMARKWGPIQYQDKMAQGVWLTYVILNDNVIGSGTSTVKQEAKEAASKSALEYLERNKL